MLKTPGCDLLIKALRRELLEAGEFLARCDDLRSSCTAEERSLRAKCDQQFLLLMQVRTERENIEQDIARDLRLRPAAHTRDFAHRIRPEYRGLMLALAEEAEDLQRRVCSIYRNN